ncbi:MAG: hypothetical protein U5Q16_01465 [Gammaproteobacteria bacterium]|nr:hypothetical protein [Gammaproteobacteria bacterium]
MLSGTAMVDVDNLSMREYVDSWRGIVLGRVFTHEAALHFVLEVDQATGLCRVSRRHAGRTEIIYMPLGEVILRVKDEA